MRVKQQLILNLDQAEDSSVQRQLLADRLNILPDQITAMKVLRRSIDARKRNIRINLNFEVYWNEEPPSEAPISRSYPALSNAARKVIIVGCGPAGMFAGLRLIEMGIKPIIIERGKMVQPRRRDLANIQRKGLVDPDSNYCFGEGGAGTYSDGKLYTRATKRGDVEGIFRTLVAHGADPNILVEAHPHVGSNKLPRVVAAMRESILGAGGEIW
ncbi:MAG: FAD-binding protein, partial [Candidatus Latescibacteria bacterium]|nr:FAD-binding protein [Candidatus Latescibacterota bacterium]